eukprot:jgi/Botrbrau1/14249/Bobra.0381s0010.1
MCQPWLLVAVAMLQHLLCIVALLIFLWSWSPFARWRLRHIPGYTGVWLLGNIPDILKRHGAASLYEEGHEKFGKVFKVWYGTKPVVVIGDPVAGRAVALRSKRRFPVTFPMTFFSGERAAIYKAELLVVEDEKYHSSLKSVWPGAFRSGKMEEYVNIMKGSVAEAIAQLQLDARQGKEINLLDFYGSLAMSIVGSTAFGVDLKMFQMGKSASGDPFGPKLVAAIQFMFNSLGLKGSVYMKLGSIIPGPWALGILQAVAAILPDPVLVKVGRARKMAFGLLYPVLREAQARAGIVTPSTKVSSPADLGFSNVVGGGFISHIVNAEHRDTKQSFTDEEILGQAYTFLAAGYETTAIFLTNATYLLLKHPEKLSKLRKELDGLTEEQFVQLASEPTPYLAAVVKETLRIYAVAHKLNRLAPCDLNVCGYHIPKGTWIHVNSYQINRTPGAWERPTEFLPERWVPGDPMETRTPENLVSFGFGALQCAGMRYAQHEVNLVLSHIFRKMDFSLSPGQDTLKWSSSFVLKPRVGVFVVPRLLGELGSGES